MSRGLQGGVDGNKMEWRTSRKSGGLQGGEKDYKTEFRISKEDERTTRLSG